MLHPHPVPAPPLLLPDASPDDLDVRSLPKKRAETWTQEEIITLISLRRDLDAVFNSSKSNKHLWDQISGRMRDRGFDRSINMCTEKWRNLLKEFKKARSQAKGFGNGKLAWYKEMDELLKKRVKGGSSRGAGAETAVDVGGGVTVDVDLGAKVDDCFVQFADKGFEDANIPYGPVEANGRSILEGRLEHDSHPLTITPADPVAASAVSPWNWRDPSTNGDNHGTFGGRVILVKWEDSTKRVGIDGTAEAIKEAIKSAFGLRTKRAFWLEDENEVVRSFDRDMPLGTYKLHLDSGITIRICTHEEADRMTIRAEEKTFYSEEDFRDFLSRRGWAALKEFNGYCMVDTLDDLRHGCLYRGTRSSTD